MIRQVGATVASRRMRGCLLLFWLAVLGSLPCASQGATAGDRSLLDFHHTAWGMKQGAPADIWALAQAPEGFLWLGTGMGLYRFDGIGFERVPTPLRSNNITALAALPGGELWMGLYSGGVGMLKDGRYTTYTERDGLPGGTVFRIERTGDGVIWAACGGGLGRFADGRWQTIGPAWNYPDASANWLLPDQDGTLWVSTGKTVVFLRRGSQTFEATGEKTGVAVLAQAADGRIWLSDDLQGTRVLRGNAAVRRDRNASPDSLLQAKRLLFTRDGELWATDTLRGGLFRVADAARLRTAGALQSGDAGDVFGHAQGLTANIAVPLLQDREGSIWVGTNLGLNRFRRNDVITERSLSDVAPFGHALAPGGEGAVWVGNGDTLYRVQPGATTPVASGLGIIECLLRDPTGTLWIASRDALHRLSQQGPPSAIALPARLRDAQPRAITTDAAGGLWLAYADTVFHYRNGAWTDYGNRSDIADNAVTAMATDAQGRIWFGYSENRISVLDGDRARRYTTDDGLQIGSITSIAPGAGRVLIGGESGVADFDGSRFRSLGSDRLDVLTGISGIVETDDGHLWMNGMSGIVRMASDEWQRALADAAYVPRYKLFDAEDGLPGIAQQIRSPSVVRDAADGLLWFVTNRGIARIDPASVNGNPVPPPVSINAVEAGGRRYATDALVTLPASTRDLQIDYAGLSLAVPERTTYRYRLEGLETDWHDAGTRRQANYANLAPGAYRFEVIAINRDGVRSEKAAGIELRILPAYYQTWWFHALIAALIVGLLFSINEVRMRNMRAELRGRLQERLAERERIARELHDTLLQSVQGLILRFQAAVQSLGNEPARRALEQVLDRAQETLVEARDRVVELRTLAPRRLAESLVAVARELAADSDSLRVEIEGEIVNLPSAIGDDVFLIGREALANAYRHSGASQVQLILHYQAAALMLRVRDNGCGIADEVIAEGGRSGHWGLRGMRERAQRIGAQLTLRTLETGGTEVELRVPYTAALARS